MRIHKFRLSRLVAIFAVLIFLSTFGRCESSTGTVTKDEKGEGDEGAGGEGDEGAGGEGDEGAGGDDNEGSGDGSGSDDEPEDEKDLYFYLFDKDSIVTEYKAPSDKDAKDEPDFLYNPKPGQIRIVEFYAHWCPHCQHFRPHYNEFAIQMKEIAQGNGIDLSVYAISCVPHRSICQNYDVNGYPRVMMFVGKRGDEHEFYEIDNGHLHPFNIMKMIKDKTGTDTSNSFPTIEKMKKAAQHDQENTVVPQPLHGDEIAFWIHKTKFDTYVDIHLSLHFAMQHGIFVGKDPPNKEARKAFADWIELLNHSLPPSWPLQGMLSDIQANITTVLDAEQNLMEIVDRYPPPRKKWSRSCSRGDPTMGYTCGLWQLFHTTMIGVVEWNNNNVADLDYLYYRPKEVGDFLRNYIEHFFGCEVCRTNFLHEYDNCNFGRCDRLISHVGDLPDWKELPLWLFELHNGVNQRLMKERAEKQHREPTPEELNAVEWPARKDCPLCWHADGRFDIDAVYSFLKLTYWPDELVSINAKRDLAISTGLHKNEEVDEGNESWVYSLVGFIIASSLLTLVSWQAQKQREIRRTGKHKKADDDNYV